MAYGFNEDKSRVEVYAKEDIKYKDITVRVPQKTTGGPSTGFGTGGLVMFKGDWDFSIDENNIILCSEVIDRKIDDETIADEHTEYFMFDHYIDINYNHKEQEGSAYVIPGVIKYRMLCANNVYYPSAAFPDTFTIRIWYISTT